MKKLIAAMFLLYSVSALANDLSFQLSSIVGDWDFPSRTMVVRVQMQSDTAIKIYYCNRPAYFTRNGYCQYFALEIGDFNRYYEGFCIASEKNQGRPCSTGMQVSEQFPSQLIYSEDPLHQYGGGGNFEGTKL